MLFLAVQGLLAVGRARRSEACVLQTKSHTQLRWITAATLWQKSNPNRKWKKEYWYGYGSIPIHTIFRGWTSIYQLFWCELQGYKVLTHPHMYWGFMSSWKTLEWKTSPVFLPIFAKCPPFFGQKPVQTTMHRQRGSLLYSSGERVEDNSMLFVLRGEASSAFNSTAMYRAKEIESISGLHTMSYLYEVARQVHFRSTMLRNIMCYIIYIHILYNYISI